MFWGGGLICVLVSIVTVTTGLQDPMLRIDTGPDAIADEFIITLRSHASRHAADGLAGQIRSVGGELIREHKVGNRRFAHVRSTPRAVARLLSNPHVEMIESNTYIHLISPVEQGVSKVYSEAEDRSRYRRSTREHTPGCHYDYPGPDGWGVIRTSHRDLPDYETAPYVWGDGDDGAGVDLYILDSGIRLDHDDFEGRAIWGKTGYGSTLPTEPDTDLNGHGTHVAGTAGGKRFGIARKSTLIACKLLNVLGSGVLSDTIVMMEFIVDRMNQQRAEGKVPRAVMNQSYGGTASNSSYARETSMQEAVDNGLLGASSAGNDARDTCRNSPTRVASVFSTVASEPDDTVASFSNWGPCADIIAPGRNIMGPSHLAPTRYVAFSGTSMASPHVAGIAARFMSSLPDDEARTMTSEKARARITKSSSRGRIHFNEPGMRAGPNHLLYRECGNVDQAEPTPPHTTRAAPASPPTTMQTPPATTLFVDTPEDTPRTHEEVGALVTATLGVSAGVVGLSFGMMALVHTVFSLSK